MNRTWSRAAAATAVVLVAVLAGCSSPPTSTAIGDGVAAAAHQAADTFTVAAANASARAGR